MIHAENLTKTYRANGKPVHALERVDLALERGDFLVIHGPSGSGKTTLLQALGGMLRPSAGTVAFQGRDVYSLSAWWRNRFRRRHIGFIFQKFFLVPYLTAYDNIRLALVIGRYQGDHRRRIVDLVDRFHLGDRLQHRPAELSAGEQQRIAAARAIAAEPDLLLADEPTGNLDTASGEEIVGILEGILEEGRTVIVVTHDEGLARRAGRVVRLLDGRLT